MKKWYKNYNGVFFCWLVLPILKWIMVYRNGDHTFFISYIVIFFIYLTESKYMCAGLQRFSRYHKNTCIFLYRAYFPCWFCLFGQKIFMFLVYVHLSQYKFTMVSAIYWLWHNGIHISKNILHPIICCWGILSIIDKHAKLEGYR